VCYTIGTTINPSTVQIVSAGQLREYWYISGVSALQLGSLITKCAQRNAFSNSVIPVRRRI
jgi:hypothetical protein